MPVPYSAPARAMWVRQRLSLRDRGNEGVSRGGHERSRLNFQSNIA